MTENNLIQFIIEEKLPQQASLTAYFDIKDEIPQRQTQIVNAIRDLGGKATMHEVARHLELPLNAISGRFSELRRKLRIRPMGYNFDGRTKKTIFELY